MKNQNHLSNIDNESYGRFTKNGQMWSLFAKFLQEEGIIAWYTMLGTPKQNGADERRNQTLMDMVKSMISNSSLPLNLYKKALKTVMYILNWVPSKVVPKTKFK